MKTHHLILGLAPALALAACGGNETTTTNATTVDNISAMDVPADANMADNMAMADAALPAAIGVLGLAAATRAGEFVQQPLR